MKTELTLTSDQMLPVTHREQPTTADLIAAVIQGGVTSDSVAVVERLVSLREREQKTEAEQAFAESFVGLQTETPKIVAMKAVPDNNGNVRYTYAPYEDIMRAVRPMLTKYGFAISYDQEIADGKVYVTCKLTHVRGHSQSNRFQCRIGSGPPKASESQSDGSATTYAKRFALCAALGITIEQDRDGADGEGDATISKEQAADLRLRCEAIPVDMARFCAWLKVSSFDEIPTEKFAMADAALRKKEKEKTDSGK